MPSNSEFFVRSTRTRYSRYCLAIFLLGLVISAIMLMRSQVTIDQFNLLARGWYLAAYGEWIPFGVRLTGGGYNPGGIISLLVGLPLFAWDHHRSSVFLILVSHVLSYLLLHRTLRRILTAEELVLFAIVYWLSPWRLFYSGFLWNPNFLFICGAIHLVTAYRLRACPAFWPSFGHILVLGIAMQLHLSALLLVVSTGLLWWRRYIRLHVGAVVSAAAVVGLSLVPWLLAVIDEPSRLPISTVATERSFVTPVLQGVNQWLRFSGVSLNRSMICLDFSSISGPGFEPIGRTLTSLRAGLALLTFVLAVWANWRFWRRPSGPWGICEHSADDRVWLEGVVRWSFIGSLFVFTISPVGVAGHSLLSLLHLAVLPVVFAVGSVLKTRRPKALLLTVRTSTALMIIVGLALAFGSPPYRCGGPHCTTGHFTVPTLKADHRMFDELGIRQTCPLLVDDAEGWYPDGLEAHTGGASCVHAN